jgi:hypothetical protein
MTTLTWSDDYLAGTRRFSSSNQFNTTLIWFVGIGVDVPNPKKPLAVRRDVIAHQEQKGIPAPPIPR